MQISFRKHQNRHTTEQGVLEMREVCVYLTCIIERRPNLVVKGRGETLHIWIQSDGEGDVVPHNNNEKLRAGYLMWVCNHAS
jgi:hypothetical protein